MEAEILIKFDFDFTVLSPIPFLERFVRLYEVHNDFFIDTLAFELLKQLVSVSKFVDVKPSHLAAATLVAVLNIAELNPNSPNIANNKIEFNISHWDERLTNYTRI
jgi:hypothetical protein